MKKAASVREVAGQFVLQSQFLFLETVEKVFVRVDSVLFFLDEGVKSGMLRFESLSHSLVHWWRSFQSACHRRVINHDSRRLSRPKKRFGGSWGLLAVNEAAVSSAHEMV